MAFDPSRYNVPGVYTQKIPGPSIASPQGGPNSLALFGTSIGYATDLETVAIPADDNGGNPIPSVPLRQSGINTATLVVSNPYTGTVYTLNDDYRVIDIPGPDNQGGTPDDTYQIERNVGGLIAAGQQISVSYQYTNVDYFEPTNFYNYPDVVDKYGVPYDSQGNITSELSLAAKFAFQNGAPVITAVAVKPSGSSATTQDYLDALTKLENDPDIAIVCPCTGSLPVIQGVVPHVRSQSLNRHERRAVVGRDGSVTPVPSSIRISSAQSLGETRVAHVSPSTMNYFNSDLNKVMTIGSQYMAVCVAAISLSQNPGIPLTRKVLQGVSSLQEVESESTKDSEAIAGLMVIEQTNQGAIRIRHGLTTDPSTLVTKEWSFTGQEDAQAFRVRNYLDFEGLIGGVINDLTLVNVKAGVAAALQSLVDDGTIRDYGSLMVRQLSNTPDVVQVQYEYLANIPLNYILVKYTVNVSDGSSFVSSSATSAAA